MNKSISNCVPRWMSKVIENKVCERCQQSAAKEDICAVGIRAFGRKKDTTFYVEHQCSKCQVRIITSFGAQKTGSAEELCYILLEQLQTQRRLQKAREFEPESIGKIRDEEVESFLSFMNENESHEDFMKFIGSKLQNDED